MPDYSAEALRRAEAKLARTLGQLAVMEAEGKETPSYTLGWATAGIKDALAEIAAWKES